MSGDIFPRVMVIFVFTFIVSLIVQYFFNKKGDDRTFDIEEMSYEPSESITSADVDELLAVNCRVYSSDKDRYYQFITNDGHLSSRFFSKDLGKMYNYIDGKTEDVSVEEPDKWIITSNYIEVQNVKS